MNSLHDDNAFFIVLNGGSGRQTADGTASAIGEVLSAAHRAFTIDTAGPGELEKVAARMAALARDRRGTLVAAGGDGTLRTVAQLAVEYELPFGVLPAGTFNYFGRTYRIPTEITAATTALLTARERAVQVGLVNGRVFLVNASVGLYPELLEDREAFKKRLGRNRFVAFCSGVATLLKDHKPLLLEFSHEGEKRTLHTSTLFIGNSRLQLEQVGVEAAEVVREGKLAAVVVRPLGRLGLAAVAIRGALGVLEKASGVESFSFTELKVTQRGGRNRSFKVATDGEIAMLSSPLEFTVEPRSLRLLVPTAPQAL